MIFRSVDAASNFLSDPVVTADRVMIVGDVYPLIDADNSSVSYMLKVVTAANSTNTVLHNSLSILFICTGCVCDVCDVSDSSSRSQLLAVNHRKSSR